jgi:transcriptional regulator with XRE-family HTH domain
VRGRDTDQIILTRIGERVRVLRERKRWSQEKLAGASGVHVTYLSGVERGRRNPTLLVLARIAKGLSVEIASLLKDEEAK